MNAKFDHRDFASIFLTRFHPDAISKITPYPTHFLELHPEPDDDVEDVRTSIPILLEKFGANLERLEIRNTFDVTQDTEVVRSVLPCEARGFSALSELTVVDFVRVNVSDAIVKALCLNEKLYAFHANEAPFTKRCIKSLSLPPRLRIISLAGCPHFPHAYETTLKRRLSSIEIIRLKD